MERERNCLRIARKYGQRQLPTQVPQFEDDGANPPGAMSRANAQSLTFAANRRRWDRQKRLRSGVAGLLAILTACSSPTVPRRLSCTLERSLPAPDGWSITMSEHWAVCPALLGATTYGDYTVRWD